jgi:aspartate/methionine/tyrosine aminotransferase
MLYKRMPIEKESPEEIGYDTIAYNLAESSVSDRVFSELNLSLQNLILAYTDHRGKPALRELLVQDHNNLNATHVLLTNGAAGALFIIHTALLDTDSHLIVLRPNYATNIEVPRAIGCQISYIDLSFEQAWKIDIDAIASQIRPNTKIISITTPHNPTGRLITEQDIDKLVALAEEKQIALLIDETYRDTCFATPYPLTATKSKWVISVSSISKAFGLPGLRMGWLMCQHDEWMEQFLAAKEMIYITNSALDEEIVYQFLLQKETWASQINRQAQANFEVVKTWLSNESRLECILPEGGVVFFPRFKEDIQIDTTQFYNLLMGKYQTMVGYGHWFEMPDRYMRIGFGWTDTPTLQQGLANISKAISEQSN